MAAPVPTQPSTSAAPPSPRLESLDGVRGLAALAVTLFHAGFTGFQGGFVGVDVFYVLSGFVITNLLIRSRPGYGRFLAQRAFRLLPALLFAMACTTAWLVARGGTDAKCTAMSVTYTMNIPALHPERCDGLLHLTWSLAFEQQFYLVWPLLIFVVPAARRKVLVLVALTAWLAAGVRILVEARGPVSREFSLLYAPDARSLVILAGAAIAVVHHLGQQRSIGPRAAAGAATAGAVVLLLSVIPAHHDSALERFIVRSGGDATRAVIAGLGAVLVIGALVLAEDSVFFAGVLRWRPLLWLGGISYSLYLIHLLTITMAQDALAHHRSTAGALGILGALVVAAGMRRWVEVPAQRWGKQLSGAGRRPVATLAP